MDAAHTGTERSTARLALRRIVAFLIDWAAILGWAAVTAAVGVPLYLAHVIKPMDPVTLNVVATAILVGPVVLAAAAFEAGRRGATPGKRVLGLTVRHGDRSPGYGRAVLRNLLKIGVPWTVGHAAVFVLATAGSAGMPTPTSGWILPIAYVVSLFARPGRALYDRVVGARVDRADRGLRA